MIIEGFEVISQHRLAWMLGLRNRHLRLAIDIICTVSEGQGLSGAHGHGSDLRLPGRGHHLDSIGWGRSRSLHLVSRGFELKSPRLLFFWGRRFLGDLRGRIVPHLQQI
jgi:hypothetical protein